jgi:hypothetical protein
VSASVGTVWQVAQAMGAVRPERAVTCDSCAPTVTAVVAVAPVVSRGGEGRPLARSPWQKVQVFFHPE